MKVPVLARKCQVWKSAQASAKNQHSQDLGHTWAILTEHDDKNDSDDDDDDDAIRHEKSALTSLKHQLIIRTSYLGQKVIFWAISSHFQLFLAFSFNSVIVLNFPWSKVPINDLLGDNKAFEAVWGPFRAIRGRFEPLVGPWGLKGLCRQALTTCGAFSQPRIIFSWRVC